MDKMTHAKVNLNNLLMGLSIALDKAFDPNRYNIEYNSQRVSFISLRLVSYIKFEEKFLADVAAYSLLGRFDFNDEQLDTVPFLDIGHIDQSIKEIVKLALLIEENLLIKSNTVVNIKEIEEIVTKSKEFSIELKDNFQDLSGDYVFWLDLANNIQLPTFIYNFLQDFTQELEYNRIVSFSVLIHKSINKFINQDCDTDIGLKCEILSEHYSLDNKDISRMKIGAYLYPLGKLFIDKDIFTKETGLDEKEKIAVSSIAYHSSNTIGLVFGFDDIAKLCSVVNEKIDGTGIPYEMDGSELSLKDRLMAILIIYQALLESRSYRKAYSHDEALDILKSEAEAGKLDKTIVEDIDRIFKG